MPFINTDISAESDEALMEEVAQGDEAALGQLYLRHCNAVRSIIGYVVPAMNSHDVDDATHEVFLSLGKAAKTYRHKSLFNAFLFRIATNRARDWQRRSWLRSRLMKFAPREDALPCSSPQPIGPSHSAVFQQTVRQIVESLSHSHREVLILHAVAGFTCEEIAEMLKIHPKTVRTRLHRARNAVLQNINAPMWHEALHLAPSERLP